MAGNPPRPFPYPHLHHAPRRCRSATPCDDAPPPPPRDGSSLPERRPPGPSTGSAPRPCEPPASLKPACPGGQAGAPPGPTPFRPTWAGHRWRAFSQAEENWLRTWCSIRFCCMCSSQIFNCKQHGRRKVPTAFDVLLSGRWQHECMILRWASGTARPREVFLLAHNLMASDERVQKSEVEDVRFGGIFVRVNRGAGNGTVVSVRVCIFSYVDIFFQWYFFWNS
uniref:Uncharacterized protein n=1 Tax=Setaria viridis TaxID=4556 RepID=A0A4U6U2W2_SETVI|nr:hypothetical protein SEVIR_6G033800v2 [Setaria viridis]